MRKIFRKAIITQILSEADISTLERDYETEELVLRGCRDNLSMYYHGMYDNSEVLEDMFSFRIRELTQKTEKYSIAEDPITGFPVLYRRIQKKRISMILTFTYRNRNITSPFSIEVELHQALQFKVGMKIWIVFTKEGDCFNIERKYI